MKRERKQTEGRQPPSLSQRSSLADSTDLVSFSRSGRTDVGLVAGRLERQLESGCPQLALTPSLSCPSLACLGARMRASTPLSATLARSRRRGVDWNVWQSRPGGQDVQHRRPVKTAFANAPSVRPSLLPFTAQKDQPPTRPQHLPTRTTYAVRSARSTSASRRSLSTSRGAAHSTAAALPHLPTPPIRSRPRCPFTLAKIFHPFSLSAPHRC